MKVQYGDVYYWTERLLLREISVPWWVISVDWTSDSDRCFPFYQ